MWTELQKKMITPDGNIRRYIHSDIVDVFRGGQCADISFPNGYSKANRVFDICPALTPTTIRYIVYKEEL